MDDEFWAYNNIIKELVTEDTALVMLCCAWCVDGVLETPAIRKRGSTRCRKSRDMNNCEYKNEEGLAKEKKKRT